jgi:hypothetical protein
LDPLFVVAVPVFTAGGAGVGVAVGVAVGAAVGVVPPAVLGVGDPPQAASVSTRPATTRLNQAFVIVVVTYVCMILHFLLSDVQNLHTCLRGAKHLLFSRRKYAAWLRVAVEIQQSLHFLISRKRRLHEKRGEEEGFSRHGLSWSLRGNMSEAIVYHTIAMGRPLEEKKRLRVMEMPLRVGHMRRVA